MKVIPVKYKEWGKEGGKSLKWNSEAERKKTYRLKKKIINNIMLAISKVNHSKGFIPRGQASPNLPN